MITDRRRLGERDEGEIAEDMGVAGMGGGGRRGHAAGADEAGNGKGDAVEEVGGHGGGMRRCRTSNSRVSGEL